MLEHALLGCGFGDRLLLGRAGFGRHAGSTLADGEWRKTGVKRRRTQIPFGNDNQKGKGNCGGKGKSHDRGPWLF
ncbi:hypothetical protein GRAN_4017 [Granulicella sibirica]|uniref:Uncharacterized protein n=1 Tax=Granulicella sibirica TaxID=2479048 RepID=A0A4Q0SV24_9BACT|nr:hypothetical protein GRAN_4017 [Granulicella sibirica]